MGLKKMDINEEIKYLTQGIILADLIEVTKSEKLDIKHLKTLYKLFYLIKVNEKEIKVSYLYASLVICAKGIMDVIKRINKNV